MQAQNILSSNICVVEYAEKSRWEVPMRLFLSRSLSVLSRAVFSLAARESPSSGGLAGNMAWLAQTVRGIAFRARKVPGF